MGKKKPADIVIDLLGVRPLARFLKLSPGAVSKWRDSGLIPSKHHEPILDEAKRKGLRLTAEMLICGA